MYSVALERTVAYVRSLSAGVAAFDSKRNRMRRKAPRIAIEKNTLFSLCAGVRP